MSLQCFYLTLTHPILFILRACKCKNISIHMYECICEANLLMYTSEYQCAGDLFPSSTKLSLTVGTWMTIVVPFIYLFIIMFLFCRSSLFALSLSSANIFYTPSHKFSKFYQLGLEDPVVGSF